MRLSRMVYVTTVLVVVVLVLIALLISVRRAFADTSTPESVRVAASSKNPSSDSRQASGKEEQSPTKAFEEKLKLLEEQVTLLQKQIEELKREQLQSREAGTETRSRIGELGQEVEKVRDEATLLRGAQVHGNGEIWLRRQDQPGTNQWAFRAHEAEVGFYNRFGNRMYALAEVEFENTAAEEIPGVESNLLEGNEITIEEFFLHYDLAKNQYLRFGLVPVMFSRFMNIRYPHRNPLVSAPTTFKDHTIGLEWFDTGLAYFGTTDPEGIVPTGLAAGLSPIGKEGSFDWWLAVTNTTPGGTGFRDKLRQEHGNKNPTYSVGVGYVPAENLHLGASFASGNPFEQTSLRNGDRRTLLEYSLDWQKIGGSFNLLGEYVLQDTGNVDGTKEKDRSWYLMGMYELPEKFDLVGRVDSFSSNYSPADNLSTWSVGLRKELYRKGFSRVFLKLEWRSFNFSSLAEAVGRRDFSDIFSSVGLNF